MTKIYTFDRKEWHDLGPNEYWRSDDIYVCKICSTETNHWIGGGQNGKHARLFCPADRYKEHDIIEELIARKQKVTRFVKTLDDLLKHPQSPMVHNAYQKLQEEQKAMGIYIQSMQTSLAAKCKDVDGLGDDARKIEYIPSFRYLQKLELSDIIGYYQDFNFEC